MKKVIFAVLIAALIVIKLMGAGYAEMDAPRWAYDPRVNIFVVDQVEDEGRYSIYFCIAEEYVVSLERQLDYDFGWISMCRDDAIVYETDWVDQSEAMAIVDRLVEKALELVGERTT